jgi:hypothetical protein
MDEPGVTMDDQRARKLFEANPEMDPAKKVMAAETPDPAPDVRGGIEQTSSPPQTSDSTVPEPPISPPVPNPFAEIRSGEKTRIAGGMSTLFQGVLARHPAIQNYCLLAIMDEITSIGSYELDRIYAGLKAQNSTRQKDVLLLLLSTGGEIEPAYQISKLCRSFSKSKFVVAVPRYAKSAATLIALGADEIHMGQLGHLGPIDPQFGGLPGLAVARALDTLAALVERHPKSAEMLARYLKDKLPVQQIGYYDRVAESAVQYAQRLLRTKPIAALADKPDVLAHSLVHDYKDHGFVIDFEEATAKLGAKWILRETPEEIFAEEIYEIVNMVVFIVRQQCDKKLALIGSLAPSDMETSLLLLD